MDSGGIRNQVDGHFLFDSALSPFTPAHPQATPSKRAANPHATDTAPEKGAAGVAACPPVETQAHRVGLSLAVWIAVS